MRRECQLNNEDAKTKARERLVGRPRNGGTIGLTTLIGNPLNGFGLPADEFSEDRNCRHQRLITSDLRSTDIVAVICWRPRGQLAAIT
jgi:hypothetical protein